MTKIQDIDIKGHDSAYIICFWQGLGNLFPWNAFITAANYFSVRFCGTLFEDNFENYFSVAFMVSQTVGLALAAKYQGHISLSSRILVPLVVMAAIFVMLTVFVTVDVGANVLFVLSLVSCFIVGASNAVLSGGLFGFFAYFPPQFTGALMSGQSLGGLAVSLVSLVSIWAGNEGDWCSDDDDGDCEEHSTDYSALAFFTITCVVLGTCVLSFLALLKLSFTKLFIVKSSAHSAEVSLLQEEQQQHDENTSKALHSGEASESVSVSVSREKILEVFALIRPAAIGVFLSLFLTLCLFPSVTVLIESEKHCSSDATRFNNDLWVPFAFVVFNLTDLIGRLVAPVFPAGVTASNVWKFAAMRVVFIPLFLLCNVSGTQLPVLFQADAFPVIFMVLFGLSNGYLCTLSMMLGPSLVPPKDAGLAGTLMIFSLTIGLMSGAVTSVLMVFISSGSLLTSSTS
jgi:solute carrier family 29 (equilibrative nucleoside transporter), member 1/2/3